MGVNRSVIKISIVLICFLFFICIMLEWRVIQFSFKATYLHGHREFFLNIVIGILSSCVLVLISSTITYIRAKRDLIGEYHLAALYLYMHMDLIKRWMLNNYKKSDQHLNLDIVELKTLLLDMKGVLDRLYQMSFSYITFITYNSRYNLLKEKQKKNGKFIYCQYIYSEHIIKLYQDVAMVLCMLDRVQIDQKANKLESEFQGDFEKYFREFVEIGNEHEEIYNTFTSSLEKYINKIAKRKLSHILL